MKKIFILIAILMMTFVAAGYAQVQKGAITISPFIGGYTFEGNEDFKNSLTVGLRGGYNINKYLGVEGVFNFVPTESRSIVGYPKAEVYGYGIEGLFHLLPESRLVPFLAVGVGGIHYANSSGMVDKNNKFTLDYGAGLKYFLTEDMALRADVRHVLPLDTKYNDLIYTLGIAFSFGGAKKVAVAEPAPVVLDSDKDGVPDNLDKCPGTPAGVAVDNDGCPLDSDKDGVPDYLDKCPGTPAGVAVDKEGCPLDSDKDGVPDYLDKCPGTPAGVKVDKDGCPPVVQETKPQAAAAPEVIEKGRVTLNVQFDTNKSVIKKNSFKDVDNLAGVMKKYSDLKVTIEGHTDNVGSAKLNEILSQKRADAVKKYMMDKYGIDAGRVSAKGYGPNKPITSNATKEGRQKNRRVEAALDYIIKK